MCVSHRINVVNRVSEALSDGGRCTVPNNVIDISKSPLGVLSRSCPCNWLIAANILGHSYSAVNV